MLVREKPPTAVSYDIQTPGGSRYRWGADERKAENVPQNGQWSDTMPGGFEQCDVTLPRKAGVDYRDLERLSTITVRGAGGGVVGEYRLERAPRVSGSQLAISPSAVGWQAALADNEAVREIFVDGDLGHWGSPSAQWTKTRGAGNFNVQAAGVQPDTTTGSPALVTSATGSWSATGLPESMGLYDAGGIPIGSLYYAWSKGSSVNNADTNWTWKAIVSTDDTFASFDESGNLRAAGPGTGTLTATTSTRTFAAVQQHYAAAAGSIDNILFPIFWTCLAVYGTHGLTKRGTASATEAQGFYASDITTNAVLRWAPPLKVTSESVQQSGLVITQAAYLEPTTVAQIIRDVTRYELLDWAVWDNKTYWQHQRGARGRSWRARIGPSQLQETGPQIDRVWNSVLVSYKDASGQSRTVGPVGSGADTETDDLRDSDPENPATKLGINRRKHLTLDVDSATLATSLGQRFLEETKRLDTSGRAQIVGYVQDDRGVTWPYHAVRAGDTITFVDASDPSPRRIVRTQKNEQARTCDVDLDAPPDGLAQVLARLGAS